MVTHRCGDGECQNPSWNSWGSWSCNCKQQNVRYRKCDGGIFDLSCLGPTKHVEKITGSAQIKVCEPEMLLNCTKDQLEQFLNLKNELNQMYKNWTDGFPTHSLRYRCVVPFLLSCIVPF